MPRPMLENAALTLLVILQSICQAESDYAETWQTSRCYMDLHINLLSLDTNESYGMNLCKHRTKVFVNINVAL